MNGEKHKVWIPGETVSVVYFMWFNFSNNISNSFGLMSSTTCVAFVLDLWNIHNLDYELVSPLKVDTNSTWYLIIPSSNGRLKLWLMTTRYLAMGQEIPSTFGYGPLNLVLNLIW